MSHIVTVETQVRDAEAVAAACSNLQWQRPLEGEHRLFAGSMRGLAVFPPAWRYPVVCELATGKLHYDNSNSRSLARLGGWLESRALGGERGASKLKARGGFSEGIVECWWRWAATWLVAEPVFSLEVQIATPA